MTFDLRKFDRVWKAAGERPEGLECHPQDDGLDVWTIDLDGIEVEDEHDPAEEWKHEDPETIADPSVLIPRQTAAAIIRDWAVGWLSSGHGAIGVEISDDVVCVYTPTDKYEGIHFFSSDRTEALYLACCKVLGIEP